MQEPPGKIQLSNVIFHFSVYDHSFDYMSLWFHDVTLFTNIFIRELRDGWSQVH